MRPVRHRRFATNGTPNSLQATVMKDFSPGLQIRPRRFDSGFGLHIRKPRRPWSTGFFYACDLADHFRNRTPSYLNCSMALFADRRLLKQPELLEQTMWAAGSRHGTGGRKASTPWPTARRYHHHPAHQWRPEWVGRACRTLAAGEGGAVSFLGIVTGLTRPLLIFTLATVWLLLMYNCKSCAPNPAPAGQQAGGFKWKSK